MSIKDITDCFHMIGMDTAAVKVGMNTLSNMPLPAILYWRQRHFVVLYKIRNGKYHIADPAQGKTVYDEEEFQHCWLPEGGKLGIAVLGEPSDSFHIQKYSKERTMSKMFSYIYSYFKDFKNNFLLILMLSLLLMGADISVPLLLQQTIDNGIGRGDMGIVLMLLLGQLAIAIGYAMSSGIMTLLLNRLGLSINRNMMETFLQRLLSFPVSFFDRRVNSDFIQKTEDQSRMKDFLLSFPSNVLMMFLNLLVFSIMLLHYSHIIFMLFIFLSILEIAWSTAFLGRRKTLNFNIFMNSSESRTHVYELTGGLPELKANNAGETRLHKWREIQDRMNAAALKQSRLNIVHNFGKTIMSRAKELSITGISALMVIDGNMSFGVMMTLGYITGRLA